MIWLLIIIGGLAGVYLKRWWCRGESGLVAAIDSCDDTSDNVRGTTKFQRAIAYEFQAKYGVLQYTAANRMIAGDFVRGRMREMSMRNVDIVRHMDVCIELCLVPTEHSVRASKFARMSDTLRRRAEVDSPK